MDEDGNNTIGIAEAAGDRYLCSENWLFRRIRNMALSEGYAYSVEQSVLKEDL